MVTVQVYQRFENPGDAKEIRLMCPHCNGTAVVSVPRDNWTARRKKISDVVDEHRRVCPAAPPDAHRVYTIEYPRA